MDEPLVSLVRVHGVTSLHTKISICIYSEFHDPKILILLLLRLRRLLLLLLLLLILLLVALQLFMQSFGLLNQFLPSSSILDKGLPIWHF